MKTKIGVLVSGGGTNLQALIDAQKSGILHSGEIAVVVCNVKDAYALTRAENASVRHETVLRRECSCAKEFEQKIDDIMRSCGVELIILAGFLYVLSKDFVQKWPDRIINIHPSLIPSFCGDGFYGLKVHEEALKYGVKVSGATVHFVNEVTDGGRIIAQKAGESLDVAVADNEYLAVRIYGFPDVHLK